MSIKQSNSKPAKEQFSWQVQKNIGDNTPRLQNIQMNLRTCPTTTSISSNASNIPLNWAMYDERQEKQKENFLKGQSRVFHFSNERDNSNKRSDSQLERKQDTQANSRGESKKRDDQRPQTRGDSHSVQNRVDSQPSQRGDSQSLSKSKQQKKSGRSSINEEQQFISQPSIENLDKQPYLRSSQSINKESTISVLQYLQEQQIKLDEPKRCSSNFKSETPKRGESASKRVEWKDQIQSEEDEDELVRANYKNLQTKLVTAQNDNFGLSSANSRTKKQETLQEWRGVSESMKKQLRKYLRDCGIFEEGDILEERIVDGSVLAKIVLKETGESLQGVFISPKNKSQVNVTFCCVLSCLRRQQTLNQRFLTLAERIKQGDISIFWGLLYDILVWVKENKNYKQRQQTPLRQNKQEVKEEPKTMIQVNKSTVLLTSEASDGEGTKVIVSSRPLSSPIKGILRTSSCKLVKDEESSNFKNNNNMITLRTETPERSIKRSGCEPSTQYSFSNLIFEHQDSQKVIYSQSQATLSPSHLQNQSPMHYVSPKMVKTSFLQPQQQSQQSSQQVSQQSRTTSPFSVISPSLQSLLPTSSSSFSQTLLRLQSPLSISQPKLQFNETKQRASTPLSSSQSKLHSPIRQQSPKTESQRQPYITSPQNQLLPSSPSSKFSYKKRGDCFEQQVELVQKRIDSLKVHADMLSSQSSKDITPKQGSVTRDSSKKVSINPDFAKPFKMINFLSSPNNKKSENLNKNLEDYKINPFTITSTKMMLDLNSQKIANGAQSERGVGREKFINKGIFNFADHFLMKGIGSVSQSAATTLTNPETPKTKIDKTVNLEDGSAIKSIEVSTFNKIPPSSPFQTLLSHFKKNERQQNAYSDQESKQNHENSKNSNALNTQKQLVIDTIQKQFSTESCERLISLASNQQANIINSLFKKHSTKKIKSQEDQSFDSHSQVKDEVWLFKSSQQPQQKDESAQEKSRKSTKEAFYSNTNKKGQDSFSAEKNQVPFEEISKWLSRIGCFEILKSIDSKDHLLDFSNGVLLLRLLETLECKRLKYISRPSSAQEIAQNIQLLNKTIKANPSIDLLIMVSEDKLIKAERKFVLALLSAICKAYSSQTSNTQLSKQTASTQNKEQSLFNSQQSTTQPKKAESLFRTNSQEYIQVFAQQQNKMNSINKHV